MADLPDLPPKWSAPLTECVFCMIRDRRSPALFVGDWGHVFAIQPIKPVTPGHLLFIPAVHVADLAESPSVTASVMEAACLYVAEVDLPDVNIITSKGAHATQTVHHLHIHVVPRDYRDKLALPWDPNGEGVSRRD